MPSVVNREDIDIDDVLARKKENSNAFKKIMWLMIKVLVLKLLTIIFKTTNHPPCVVL
jgi:hypothetical protein